MFCCTSRDQSAGKGGCSVLREVQIGFCCFFFDFWFENGVFPKLRGKQTCKNLLHRRRRKYLRELPGGVALKIRTLLERDRIPQIKTVISHFLLRRRSHSLADGESRKHSFHVGLYPFPPRTSLSEQDLPSKGKIDPPYNNPCATPPRRDL